MPLFRISEQQIHEARITAYQLNGSRRRQVTNWTPDHINQVSRNMVDRNNPRWTSNRDFRNVAIIFAAFGVTLPVAGGMVLASELVYRYRLEVARQFTREVYNTMIAMPSMSLQIVDPEVPVVNNPPPAYDAEIELPPAYSATNPNPDTRPAPPVYAEFAESPFRESSL